VNAIFRLSGVSRRNEAVEAYLTARPDELHSLARRWFTQLRESGDDVRETMNDGQAWACIGDAAFAYVRVAKSHVTVGFFHGTALEDPARLLAGAGKRGRHVKVRPDSSLDTFALNRLIAAAYRDMKARVKHG
jgi:hypothetical protein